MNCEPKSADYFFRNVHPDSTRPINDEKETATCHLPDFLAQHQPELCTIHDYLTAHPNAVKDQSRVERLLAAAIENPRTALGQASCWPLGDVIIALQVPENATLWTLDSDFAPLLTAVGRRLYGAQ